MADPLKIPLEEGALRRGLLFLSLASAGAGFAINLLFTPTLSMGVAMNHVAAVIMPFLGGLLWNSLGYRWAFLIGIPAAAASILIVLRLPGSSPERAS